MALASDLNNPEFVGAHNPDAALVVRFYSKPIEQPFLSKNEGRPIFQDQDYIQIFTPGNQLNIIDRPVLEEHRRRFPVQWSAYQNAHSGDQREIGTPVSQWPFLKPAQAEEFKALKFFTVEQLANASDQQLQALGMVGGANPHVIRARAQAYLAAAAGSAPSEKQAEELAETKAQLAALQAQVASLLSGAPPSKPKERTAKQLANDERLRQKATARREALAEGRAAIVQEPT